MEHKNANKMNWLNYYASNSRKPVVLARLIHQMINFIITYTIDHAVCDRSNIMTISCTFNVDLWGQTLEQLLNTPIPTPNRPF